MRPTVRDVAEEAGVSLATVDRVLNRRAGVRGETIARVEAAVTRLGFVRDMAAANLAKQRVYRFVFIIPSGPNTFMRTLEEHATEAGRRAALDRIEVKVVTVPPFDGAALAAALDAIDTRAVSGVALVATDSAPVREALARLHRAGIPVVTLVSDVPAFRRSHYVGIDNVAAGRTAASLIGRFVGGSTGKIALIAGSRKLREIVLAATVFTIAHSVTFILAATKVVSLPSIIIEPTIALSIAIVAAWYLFRLWREGEAATELTRDSGPLGLDRAGWLRLLVVFCFGLIHGLGFASALGIDEPWSWTLLWSLLVFNLGIEAVQIGLIALVFPVLVLLRRRTPRLAMWATGALAVAVTLAGLIWFVQRVFGWD